MGIGERDVVEHDRRVMRGPAHVWQVRQRGAGTVWRIGCATCMCIPCGHIAHLAMLDGEDAVGVHHLVGVVRDHHDRSAALVHAFDDREHVIARLRVEHRRRLVEHEHTAVHGEHAGDRDALLLAAAHGGGVGVAQGIHANRAERAVHTVADQRRGHAEILRTERHVRGHGRGHDLVPGVLEDDADRAPRLAVCVGVGAVRVVEHGVAHQLHRAVVGGGESGDQACERGLAGAIGAYERNALTGPDTQVHAVEHPCGAAVVAEPHAVEFDRRVCACTVRHRLSRFEIGL